MAVEIFPFPSSNIHVTIVVPCAVIGKTVAVVPVIIPVQLSAVVGIAKEATEHSAVTSASIGTIGAVISFIITFWSAVEMFPFPSSNVHVTAVIP
ncbi:hypothetical protein D3C87_985730 [compost metagenome]